MMIVFVVRNLGKCNHGDCKQGKCISARSFCSGLERKRLFICISHIVGHLSHFDFNFQFCNVSLFPKVCECMYLNVLDCT